MSLFGVRPGQEAEVRVAHRMQEDYQPPKNVVKPFAGTGNRLGSHVPAAAAPLSSASATAPVGKVVVDETKPKTSVQLRMADGTR